MTYDQMCDIVEDTFFKRWTTLAKSWDPAYLRTAVFPAMGELSENHARAAAVTLCQNDTYRITIGKWRTATVALRSEAGEGRRVRVDCPDCHGEGYVGFTATTWRDRYGKRHYDAIGHYDDLRPRADGETRYQILHGCGCENTPHGVAVDRAMKAEIMRVTAEWESKTREQAIRRDKED